jgi:hypothetical protein
VDVTEIVVEDPDVEVCNLAGNGLPGAFLAELFESDGLTIFGERVELFLATASGKPSKSELLGLGDYEFVPWQIGIMS